MCVYKAENIIWSFIENLANACVSHTEGCTYQEAEMNFTKERVIRSAFNTFEKLL